MPAARRIAGGRLRPSCSVGPALLLAGLGLSVVACTAIWPGPATAPARTQRPATPHSSIPAEGLPRLIVTLPDDGGATWWLTAPGEPSRRTAIKVPDSRAWLGPVAVDGTIALVTPTSIVRTVLDGDALRPVTKTAVPEDRTIGGACMAGDGRLIAADAETYELLDLVPGEARPFTDVPFTIGECAPLADGRTLVAVDGGGLLTIGADGDATPIPGAHGRRLSGGGGRVAMTDPTATDGLAIVRQATITATGELGPELGRVVGDPGRRLTRVQLSADGQWLAVTLVGVGDAQAQMQFYRVGDDRLTLAASSPIELDARLVILPP
ncbi:MAG TPA: hypothetical protein VIF84_00390 [Candidatus Limnocylindrales bacterium]